jgi:hypothetical protein
VSPRTWVARAVVAAVAAGCLVALPLTQLTDTGLERDIKDRLGLLPDGPENCWAPAASPGWAAAAPLPERRDEPRAVTLDGGIYLAGGIDRIVDYGEPSGVSGVEERVEVESSDELLRFDPTTEAYERRAPLPQPLNHLGFAAYDDDAYAVGGHGNLLGGAAPQRDLYRYSPDTDAWSRCGAAPPSRLPWPPTA